MWRGCRELNSDLKVVALRPHPLDHIPTLEAAARFELASSEVEARSIGPLCYAASLLLLVRDVGIEPTSSRLKGECICHLCQSPMFNIKVVQDVGIEPTPRGYRPRARPSS